MHVGSLVEGNQCRDLHPLGPLELVTHGGPLEHFLRNANPQGRRTCQRLPPNQSDVLGANDQNGVLTRTHAVANASNPTAVPSSHLHVSAARTDRLNTAWQEAR